MIDENKLLKDLDLYINRSSPDEFTVRTELSVGEIRSLIKKQNKIPPVYERHGKWICIGTHPRNDDVFYQCSICSNIDSAIKGFNIPYCCYCGSKMEGDKKI